MEAMLLGVMGWMLVDRSFDISRQVVVIILYNWNSLR